MFFVFLFLTMSLRSQVEILLTDVEKTWLKNNPVIRVSNEMDWAPYDYNVKGKPQGYSVAFIQLLADRLGIRLEFVNGYSWKRLLESRITYLNTCTSLRTVIL